MVGVSCYRQALPGATKLGERVRSFLFLWNASERCIQNQILDAKNWFLIFYVGEDQTAFAAQGANWCGPRRGGGGCTQREKVFTTYAIYVNNVRWGGNGRSISRTNTLIPELVSRLFEVLV